MAVGNPGGAGGAGTVTRSITRLDVIDPHLVLMMRDVMEGTDSSTRLKVCSRAAGGGGGGGGAEGVEIGGSGNAGGGGGSAVANTILEGSSGAGGAGGYGSSASP